jgi:hypothetical protein
VQAYREFESHPLRQEELPANVGSFYLFLIAKKRLP